MGWQIDDTFGWGLAGLNIFREWALGSDVVPLSAVHIPEGIFPEAGEDDARRIEAARRASNEIAGKIAAAGQEGVTLNTPVIAAMGNSFEPTFNIRGSRNIARIVFEATNIQSKIAKLAGYDAVACASRWNADLLRAKGQHNVHVVHEGVDQRIFYPAPKTGLFDSNRFYIFSGGKIEFRKAQDKILLAFKAFSERHEDAVLVTAWQSNWPQAAVGFQGYSAAPLGLSKSGMLDIVGWAAQNGIRPTNIIDLGIQPNRVIAKYMRECDCAVQISRAEGGTNFFAMEAMASGLATVIAGNTGMRDLIGEGNCLPLRRQSPVRVDDEYGTQGWGECDVDEIVEAFQKLYDDNDARAAIGRYASSFMAKWRWSEHARTLAAIAV